MNEDKHIELRCATWIRPLVDPAKRRDAVARTRVRLCELQSFDAIAFTGLSGSVIAGAVALAMEDRYGDPFLPVPLSVVLSAIQKSIKGQKHPYRRLAWAVAILKSMASDPEGVEVLFYGH